MKPQATALPLLLTGIGGVYVSQSLITGVALQGLPALLRSSGASLQMVGLSALFMLPWACKFLWAPWIERYRLPIGGDKRSRQIIIGGQVLLVLLFWALAASGMSLPAAPPAVLITGLILAAFLAASIDIACDGYAIDQLVALQRGWANVAQVGGSYIGMLLGSGLFLLLASAHGWPLAMAVMGGLLLAFSLPFLRLTEAARAPAAAAHRPGLPHALRRPEIRAGLALTVGLGLGVRLVLGSVGPLLLDRGLSLNQLAYLSSAGGVAAGLAGTALGGLLVRHTGAWRAVLAATTLQTLLLAGLAASAASAPPMLLEALAVALYLALACGFVTVYSLLMGCTSPHQAGLDFTLFQCADALVAVVAGVSGGWLAQRLGYATCFALAAAWTGAALLFICVRPARATLIYSGEPT